jgi:hypothetical protein
VVISASILSWCVDLISMVRLPLSVDMADELEGETRYDVMRPVVCSDDESNMTYSII